MKNSIPLTLLISAFSLNAAVLVDDSFNFGGTNEYISGTVDSQNPSATGTGWSGAWSESLGNDQLRFLGTDSSDLSYTDGNNQKLTAVNGGSSGSLQIQSTGGGFGNTSRGFSDISGTIYFSFLISVPDAPSTSFGLSFLNGSNGRYFITRGDDGNTDDIRLGMNVFDGGGAIFAPDSSLASWSTAEFMVGRITGAGTSNTTLDLWVNPTDLSDIGSAAVTASLNVSTAGSASITGFNIGYANGEDGTTLDEFRIGESFADVAPFTVVPEPSSYALISGALALGWIMTRRRK